MSSSLKRFLLAIVGLLMVAASLAAEGPRLRLPLPLPRVVLPRPNLPRLVLPPLPEVVLSDGYRDYDRDRRPYPYDRWDRDDRYGRRGGYGYRYDDRHYDRYRHHHGHGEWRR